MFNLKQTIVISAILVHLYVSRAYTDVSGTVMYLIVN